MKKIVIILSLLLVGSFAEAQSWQRDYGIKNSYDGNDAIETYDKGLFIVSQTTLLFGVNSLLIKTDVNGNILWKKYTDTFMTVYQVVQSKDGGLVLGGTVFTSGSNNTYAFVMKLNSCGDIVWTTQIFDTFPSYEDLFNLYIKPNGDLLVVSYGHNYHSPNDYPAIIICLDSIGKFKWTYGEGSNIDHLHISKDGSILSTGFLYTYDSGDTVNSWIHTIVSLIDSNGKKIWSDIYGQDIHKYGADGLGFNSPNNTYTSIHQNYDSNFLKEGNFYMIRFDSTGKKQWVRYFGDTTRNEALNDGLAINDSTYIVVGASSAITANSKAQIHLFKVNSSGKVLASKDLSAPLRAYSTTIQPTYDGKYLVCNSVAISHIDSVWRDSTHRYKIAVTHTYYYTHLIKIDENLNEDTFNNSLHLNYDSLCAKKITSGDTLFFPKKYNVIRVDTMHLYTGVEEPTPNPSQERNENFNIFPNPFTDYTTLQYSLNKTGHVNISVFDMLGRQVANLQDAVITPGNYSFLIEPDKYGLVQGIYIVKIYINDNLTVKRIIKLK